MKILAIDVGLLNLALIGANLPENYLERDCIIEPNDIFLCELVNIIELMKECKDPTCELLHDLIITDYTMHLFKKFKSVFESADLILIERQPPTGLVAVQELIMREYRSKSKLISPTAMLNFFRILHHEYLERKVHTEKIAMKYLGSLKIFVFNERRHDMADAFCILYYYLSLKHQENKEFVKRQEQQTINRHFITKMQEFVYKG